MPRRLIVSVASTSRPLEGHVEVEGTAALETFHGVMELVAVLERLLETPSASAEPLATRPSKQR